VFRFVFSGNHNESYDVTLLGPTDEIAGHVEQPMDDEHQIAEHPADDNSMQSVVNTATFYGAANRRVPVIDCQQHVRVAKLQATKTGARPKRIPCRYNQ